MLFFTRLILSPTPVDVPPYGSACGVQHNPEENLLPIIPGHPSVNWPKDRADAWQASHNPELAHQRPATVLIPALADLEDDVRRGAGGLPGKKPVTLEAADLGHRALRAPVVFADPEDHGIDESEGVIEHQPLDLAVGRAAPMAAYDKRPADLDLAALAVMAVVAAGADQPVGRPVDEHKRHLRGDRAVEILPERRLRVAVGRRMHLPDLRIGAGGEQLWPVSRG
jgi:hypothetical protein